MVAPPKPTRITLGAAAASWTSSLDRQARLGHLSPATVDIYRRDLTDFTTMAGRDVIVDDITPADLEDCVDKFAALPDRRFTRSEGGPRSKAATNRFQQSLRIFFAHAAKQRWVQANPFDYADIRLAKVDRVQPSRKALTAEQALLLLTVGPGDPPPAEDADRSPYWRDRFLLALLAMTGVRVSEACRANQADFSPTMLDGRPHTMWTVYGKGRKTRVVPMTTHLLRLWDDYRAHRPHPSPALPDATRRDAADALLLTRNGARLAPRDVQRMMEKASRRVQRIDPTFTRSATPHALRHTVATTLLADGVNVAQLRDLLGHESLRTLSRYVDVLPHDLAAIFTTHPLSPAQGT